MADPIFLTEEYIKRLEALGELEIYDNVPASQNEFIERIKDAEVIIVGRYGVDAKALRSAPKLKMISLWQTGFDNVDLEVATECGVIVSNVPNYAFDSVAEFVFALSLDLLRRVRLADMSLRKGLFNWKVLYGKPAHEQDYRRAWYGRHRKKDNTDSPWIQYERALRHGSPQF